jgi:hypothetical protein
VEFRKAREWDVNLGIKHHKVWIKRTKAEELIRRHPLLVVDFKENTKATNCIEKHWIAIPHGINCPVNNGSTAKITFDRTNHVNFAITVGVTTNGVAHWKIARGFYSQDKRTGEIVVRHSKNSGIDSNRSIGGRSSTRLGKSHNVLDWLDILMDDE